MTQSKTSYTSDEIEVHIRTYRSLLKSTGSVKIAKLIDSHLSMNSILHEKGKTAIVDIAAFIYVLLRLPKDMPEITEIILGQSYSVFKNHKLGKIKYWKSVQAVGRRRKMYYDGKSALAVYIASVTDVDDLITLLTAYQIEWNKFHLHLHQTSDAIKSTAKLLPEDDLLRLKNIWGEDFSLYLSKIKNNPVDFSIKLLSGSYVEYAKATQHWFNHIVNSLRQFKLIHRPIYFISSNTHSLVNLLTRFVVESEKSLVDYLNFKKDKNLIDLWKKIDKGKYPANREFFLYYLAKKYARYIPQLISRKKKLEKKLGIHHIPASYFLDIDAQVIELSKLSNIKLDNRLGLNTNFLSQSEAIILNIDYPLGWAAYQILTEIGQNVDKIRGVYITGKAAALNGQIGDILIPHTVYDQHTKNIFAFDNCLKPRDFAPIFATGNVMDAQKTICAKGTFLENKLFIQKWARQGYSIIEMETGPYLNAAYEFVYYNRYTENQFINLHHAPFQLGIAHYVSDTPYSKAKNLGVRNLSYEGVEPVYAITLAILKKIIENEKHVLKLS